MLCVLSDHVNSEDAIAPPLRQGLERAEEPPILSINPGSLGEEKAVSRDLFFAGGLTSPLPWSSLDVRWF